MIRRGNFKYLRFPPAPEVLFDLAQDPDETRNVIDDPAHAGTVAALRQRLDEFCSPPK